jgi:hypothetical protein
MATPKKVSKGTLLHDLPGLAITDPWVKPFTVEDNNGNWKIQRPLFRWVRVDKSYAEDEAKMLNIGYTIAILDILAKRPEALAMMKKLKVEMTRINKQFKNKKFD